MKFYGGYSPYVYLLSFFIQRTFYFKFLCGFIYMFRWYTAWQRYTGQPVGAYTFGQPLAVPNTAERPGPIDNSDIIVRGSDNDSDGAQVLRTSQEGLNYELVPKEAWEKLFEW